MHVLRTKVDTPRMRQVMAYCRVRKCTPNQFLYAAIDTELRELMGNAPNTEIKGDENRVTNNVHNTTNVTLFSGNTLLSNLSFFLFPMGGSWLDWARAITLYALGGATIIFMASIN